MNIMLAHQLAVDRILAEVGAPSSTDYRFFTTQLYYGDRGVSVGVTNDGYTLSLPSESDTSDRFYVTDFFDDFSELLARLKEALKK